MSQLIRYTGGVSPATPIETITGNTGGPVGPDGAGNINIVGSGNITVTGDTGINTETITIVGTTNHAVQVGNAVGSLTSIPVGTTGQVLTGVTGANPVFAAPAASSISITGDTGGPIVGNAFIFTGGTTGLSFGGAGITETLTITNLNLPVTNAAATNGVITWGGTSYIHTLGTRNIFLGRIAGNFGLTVASATDNTSVGYNTFPSITTAEGNLAAGSLSGFSLTTGVHNTLAGMQSGVNLLSGSNNVLLGFQCGLAYTGAESSNIILGNTPGTVGESNVFRVGSTTGTGIGQINTTNISGIYNRPFGATNGVVSIDNTGILGSSNGTNGQVLIGGGTGSVWANITAGSNITITNAANSITIAAGTGANIVNYTAVNHAASPYTAVTTDYYISADVTAGVVSILLPNATTLGRVFIIKDKVGLAATSNITITTVGGAVNIDGATTFVMNTAYEAVQLIGNGVSYEIF